MIRTVADTGSTNADLLVAARDGAPEGTWLRAERQHSGRGRMGRMWQSPAGNLHASTIVRPAAADPPVPGLALVAGVAFQEVADAYARAAHLQLKWPNDLMAGAAKVGGILLERADDAVVIGFGLNLTHSPGGLERPVTSIAALCGHSPDPALLLMDLAGALAAWVARWRGEGLAPVVARWLSRAHPVGTALVAATAEGPREGLFDGLSADGALRLREADGTIAVVRAGDVFLI